MSDELERADESVGDESSPGDDERRLGLLAALLLLMLRLVFFFFLAVLDFVSSRDLDFIVRKYLIQILIQWRQLQFSMIVINTPQLMR